MLDSIPLEDAISDLIIWILIKAKLERINQDFIFVLNKVRKKDRGAAGVDTIFKRKG